MLAGSPVMAAQKHCSYLRRPCFLGLLACRNEMVWPRQVLHAVLDTVDRRYKHSMVQAHACYDCS